MHKRILALVLAALLLVTLPVGCRRASVTPLPPPSGLPGEQSAALSPSPAPLPASPAPTTDAAPLTTSESGASDIDLSPDTGCPLCGADRDLFVTSPALRGADVGELQDRLAVLGYYAGPFHWTYDAGVASAVRALQRHLDLAETGVVTPAFWRALGGETEPIIETVGLPKGEARLVIDTDKRMLYVYFDDALYAKYPVAVGKSDSPTPVGDWHIKDKRRNWGQGFGSRFMLLDVPWGVYGIHGTNKPYSIGSAASHGCIRMYDRNVEKVYNLVKVGTSVRITGLRGRQRLCRGNRGPDVMEVQAMLAEEGFFEGAIDGYFGELTEQAVIRFQTERGLTPHGQVDRATYNALGL